MNTVLKDISPFNNRSEMPKPLFVIKKILAFALCYWVGMLVAEIVVILLHFAVGKNPLEGEMFDPDTITLIAYYGLIIPVLVTLLYWKIIEKKSLSEMGLRGNIGHYLLGGVVAVILLIISVEVIAIMRAIRFVGVVPAPDVVLIILMFLGFVIQGACEEFLCRGLVLCSLKDKAGIPAAIAVSTVLFVIPHFSSMTGSGPAYLIVGTVNLILISCILSFLMLSTKSIWTACGLHTVWNAALNCIFGLNLSGNTASPAAVLEISTSGMNLLNGGEYGIEASIVTAVVLAAAAVIFWRVWRSIEPK